MHHAHVPVCARACVWMLHTRKQHAPPATSTPERPHTRLVMQAQPRRKPVPGLGFRVSGLNQGFGFRDSGVGIRVSGFGFKPHRTRVAGGGSGHGRQGGSGARDGCDV
jgi:hypothetical protein